MKKTSLFAAAALASAACGTAVLEYDAPEADRLEQVQHGLQIRLEEKFGKGARVQQVFGAADTVVLGVALEEAVPDADVAAPLALATYQSSTDVLQVLAPDARYREARLLDAAGATALVTTERELKLRGADGAEKTLATQVKGEVSAAPGQRLLFTREGLYEFNGESQVALVGEDGQTVVLADAEGVDDRPAVSPDGKTVVFVSGRTGIASLWVTDLAGAPAVQLTNRSLVQSEDGSEPKGFVPVPVMADALTWQSNDVVRFDAGGGELWTVNVKTGAAARVGGAP